jgi:hypothetical protein
MTRTRPIDRKGLSAAELAQDEPLRITLDEYATAEEDGGTADQLSAIQEWLADCAGYKAEGIIPPKTYRSSCGIVHPANVTVSGYGYNSCIKLIDQFNAPGNGWKIENVENAVVRNFRLDGNRAGQGAGLGISYAMAGLYISAAKCRAESMWVHDWGDEGVHAFNCSRLTLSNILSFHNLKNGFNLDQCIAHVALRQPRIPERPERLPDLRGHDEQSTSARALVAVIAIGNGFDTNGNNGLVIFGTWAQSPPLLPRNTAGPTSAANYACFNAARNNLQSGIVLWIVDYQCVGFSEVYGNGAHGVHVNKGQHNYLPGMIIRDNSQSLNSGFDEIMVESNAGDNSGSRPAQYNVFHGGSIKISASVKARYCIQEGAATDGPNYYIGIDVPFPGFSGQKIAIGHPNSIVRDCPGAVSEGYGIYTASGNASTKTWSFAHGHDAGLRPSRPQSLILVTPGSPDAAAAGGWWARLDPTNANNIEVNTINAPPGGTNNVVWRWQSRYAWLPLAVLGAHALVNLLRCVAGWA